METETATLQILDISMSLQVTGKLEGMRGKRRRRSNFLFCWR